MLKYVVLFLGMGIAGVLKNSQYNELWNIIDTDLIFAALVGIAYYALLTNEETK